MDLPKFFKEKIMIGRNDVCWCGSGKKWKKCHFPHTGNSGVSNDLKRLYYKKHHIIIKNEEEIRGIREACKLASFILDETCKKAKKGVTTKELNDFAHQLHVEAGAIPGSLGYGHPPFPASICTSLNEVICHGFPDEVPLKDGDILNIDVALLYKGFYGDNSKMVVIGSTTAERQLVVDVSYECLMRAIAILKPGIPVYAIGDEIESYAASKGCSVVHQFVAHGVGVEFHEGPQVPHSRNRIDIKLVPGMTFTIYDRTYDQRRGKGRCHRCKQ
jgi:methionyl aminopeptidase